MKNLKPTDGNRKEPNYMKLNNLIIVIFEQLKKLNKLYKHVDKFKDLYMTK